VRKAALAWAEAPLRRGGLRPGRDDVAPVSLAVGDGDFFEILRRRAASRSGDNVTTGQFIRLAEEVSGKNLDGSSTDGCSSRRSQGCSRHQGSREVRRSPRSRFDPIF